MTIPKPTTNAGLLLIIAGAKGAVGSTLAAAAASATTAPQSVLPYLNTNGRALFGDTLPQIDIAGWDIQETPLFTCIQKYGIIPSEVFHPLRGALEEMPVCTPPAANSDFKTYVRHICGEIKEFTTHFPNRRPVFVNLLPAGSRNRLPESTRISDLLDNVDPNIFPDLAYGLAAIQCGVPVVNFSPNEIEIPAIIAESERCCVSLCGRDGKTGQTYFKTVLASALKARSLYVNGWYSLNILGNEDGKNLMNPTHAEAKLFNKTAFLDDILGYPVEDKNGRAAHKVHIDYYPPRGDAKEAWDVIDFQGLFDLPMSMRINLQGRDSILAAPMIIDLARWITALQTAGCYGPISGLGFYFKNPVGENAPVGFQRQIDALDTLERYCDERLQK